jgi:hypothetical protein
MKTYIPVVIGALFLTWSTKAQVGIAPAAVFINGRGVGSTTIMNTGAVSMEVGISFQFGYPDELPDGGLMMVYDDTVRKLKYALDGMIRAYPKSFTLPPGGKQIVRMQVRPPGDAQPGVYFTRVKVSSQQQLADIGEGDPAEGLATQINMRFEQVVAAFYKSGSVSTGIEVTKLHSRCLDQQLNLEYDFKRTGNAPFLGNLITEVLKANDEVVLRYSRPVALYFDGSRKLGFQLGEKKMEAGTYSVRLTFTTERSDIDPAEIVAAHPYIYQDQIVIPE